MKKIFATFVMLSFALSCATTNAVTKNDSGFDKKKIMNKEFVLENIYKDLVITIGFDKDKVFGFSGINRYFGPYSLDGDKIEFKNTATTMMAGPPENMKAEKDYLEMLSKATNISIKDDKLVLKLSNAKELVYKKK